MLGATMARSSRTRSVKTGDEQQQYSRRFFLLPAIIGLGISIALVLKPNQEDQVFSIEVS
jgi:hypothetical protein